MKAEADTIATGLSEVLQNADTAIAERQDASTGVSVIDAQPLQAVADALAKSNPPIAPVFTGHTEGLYGELSAKASTLKGLIDDLDSKTQQVELDADAAVQAITSKRQADIAQIAAERENALKAWTALSTCANALVKK